MLPDKTPTETVKGVVLYAPNCLLGTCASQSLTLAIRPPGPKPTPNATVKIVESVGPETNFGTIEFGNANKSGAEIVLFPDSARISVRVRGQSLNGAPGKFRAIYRVSWQ